MSEVFIGENGGLYSFLYEMSLEVGVGEKESSVGKGTPNTLPYLFVLISCSLFTCHPNSNLVNPFIKFLFLFA